MKKLLTSAALLLMAASFGCAGEPTLDELPAGIWFEDYSAELPTGYTWSSDNLPAGLEIGGTQISGAPEVKGTFDVTLTATAGNSDFSVSVPLTVDDNPDVYLAVYIDEDDLNTMTTRQSIRQDVDWPGEIPLMYQHWVRMLGTGRDATVEGEGETVRQITVGAFHVGDNGERDEMIIDEQIGHAGEEGRWAYSIPNVYLEGDHEYDDNMLSDVTESCSFDVTSVLFTRLNPWSWGTFGATGQGGPLTPQAEEADIISDTGWLQADEQTGWVAFTATCGDTEVPGVAWISPPFWCSGEDGEWNGNRWRGPACG